MTIVEDLIILYEKYIDDILSQNQEKNTNEVLKKAHSLSDTVLGQLHDELEFNEYKE
jgi:hypothetical protein|tara:strand:+ start:4841 stop:5011 length:171 start_codon:yes stop_codon:yes gene_type:complete